MASMKRIKEIAQSLDTDSMDYMEIGIRVQEDTFGAKVGDTISHCSKVWDDGEELDEELNGVSALDPSMVRYISDYTGYFGNVVLVLGTDGNVRSGEDAGEIVMERPTIIDIIYIEE